MVKITKVNYHSIFISLAPEDDLIKLFSINLLTLYCKLHLFKAIQEILLMLLKGPIYKSLRKFTSK
jgi:hypothetical protein